jgi:peptidoglycan/xylan/chitin deacetylase (PgdA/CDA1 family)
MYRVEQALERIVGVKPAFMRPPYGYYNDTVRSIAASRGQTVVMWDLDSGDADGKTVSQSEAIYQNAVDLKVNNLLALNHETERENKFCPNPMRYHSKLARNHRRYPHPVCHQAATGKRLQCKFGVQATCPSKFSDQINL